MYQFIPQSLVDSTLKLSRIADEGLLRQTQLDIAAALRESGGIPHESERRKQINHLQANGAVKAREIAKVVSYCYAWPIDECEQIAFQLLVMDPWSVIAQEVIDDRIRDLEDAAKDEKAAKTNGKPARRPR